MAKRVCLKCGVKIEDNTLNSCPRCGFPLDKRVYEEEGLYSRGQYIFIIFFMIFSCVLFPVCGIVYSIISPILKVLGLLFLIPLVWMIPMTIKVKKRNVVGAKKLSTGFKVCTLFFVSIISGLLMLCDDDI